MMMRGLSRAMLVGLAVLGLAGGLMAQGPAPAKSVAVTRIFSGPDGESHAEEMRIAQPERNGGYFSGLMKGDGMVLLTRPGGAVDDWHTAGARVQMAITVAGRAQIELGGGQKILLEPGKMILFEDKTGHGHKLTVLGSESWTAAFVRLE